MLQLICIFILKADNVLVIFLPKANGPLSSLSLGFWYKKLDLSLKFGLCDVSEESRLQMKWARIRGCVSALSSNGEAQEKPNGRRRGPLPHRFHQSLDQLVSGLDVDD